MSADTGVEEELLRSIEEVEERIIVFRNRVRAVLDSAQTTGVTPATGTKGTLPVRP